MIKSIYKYFPKKWMMNKSEYKLYKLLLNIIDSRYVVIPQVHLDDLVNAVYTSQKNRLYSIRHINQKSVDFVICVKGSMHPILAIELDDKSHEKIERKDRDIEVERILGEARIELLRFKKYQNQEEIKNDILNKLNLLK